MASSAPASGSCSRVVTRAPRPRRVRVRGFVRIAAVVVVVSGMVSGCRPSQPDSKGWTSSTEQSVGDMVSEVATTRLVVQQYLGGRFVGRSARVTLTYAKEAAGKASEAVTTVQPPPSARSSYATVTKALQDAGDAITAARIAVTDGDESASRKAVGDLDGTLRTLRRLDGQLKAAQKAVQK